ncbi:MAG TPA: hypothetical protein VM821_01340 [Abditibacteriaceae bacterium]|nr:hypothetical protein [Abditibacteriaceae bacterium]
MSGRCKEKTNANRINEDDESESSTRKSDSSVCSALSLRTK